MREGVAGDHPPAVQLGAFIQVEIEGQTCTGQAAVSGNCRIEGEEFALSLEEL